MLFRCELVGEMTQDTTSTFKVSKKNSFKDFMSNLLIK